MYYATFYLINKKDVSPITAKFLLILISIMGAIITLIILGGALIPTLIFAYCSGALLSGLVIKIQKRVER